MYNSTTEKHNANAKMSKELDISPKKIYKWLTVHEKILLKKFKITVESDCSHEIKRRLLLGRKNLLVTVKIYLLHVLDLYNGRIGKVKVCERSWMIRE